MINLKGMNSYYNNYNILLYIIQLIITIGMGNLKVYHVSVIFSPTNPL